MKKIYPVIAAIMTACLLGGCLRYDSNLLVHTSTDPTVTKTMAAESGMANLPFAPPETTIEPLTESTTAEENTEESTTAEAFRTQAETQTKPVPAEPVSEVDPQTEAAPQTEDEWIPQLTYGTAGRIDIDSVGIGVPLYFAQLGVDDVQRIVDTPECAAYFWYKGVMPVVADHNDQGFANLRYVQKGDIAVSSFADGHRGEYVCNCVCYGTNSGTALLDSEGFDVAGTVTADLIMYTCYDGWRNVLITYWKAI